MQKTTDLDFIPLDRQCLRSLVFFPRYLQFFHFPHILPFRIFFICNTLKLPFFWCSACWWHKSKIWLNVTSNLYNLEWRWTAVTEAAAEKKTFKIKIGFSVSTYFWEVFFFIGNIYLPSSCTSAQFKNNHILFRFFILLRWQFQVLIANKNHSRLTKKDKEMSK